MHDSVLRALQTHRTTLRHRWERLLRAAPVTSPLANPDSLIYLMDWTLDRLLDELRAPLTRKRTVSRTHTPASERAVCPCGLNPLLAYFSTAEQAIVETLFVADGDLNVLGPIEREASLGELKAVFSHVARREIESFCAVCQRNHCDRRIPCKNSVVAPA